MEDIAVISKTAQLRNNINVVAQKCLTKDFNTLSSTHMNDLIDLVSLLDNLISELPTIELQNSKLQSKNVTDKRREKTKFENIYNLVKLKECTSCIVNLLTNLENKDLTQLIDSKLSELLILIGFLKDLFIKLPIKKSLESRSILGGHTYDPEEYINFINIVSTTANREELFKLLHNVFIEIKENFKTKDMSVLHKQDLEAFIDLINPINAIVMPLPGLSH
jgi:hypothetical protein